MKITFIFAIFLVLILACSSLSSASTYSIELSQVDDKIVVKEIVDGAKISNFVDSATLDRSGSKIYFIKKILFDQSFSDVEIRFNLDKGVIIKEGMVFPAGYNIESDGQIISLVWNLKNVAQNQNFAMFLTLEDTGQDYSFIYWIAGIIILIIAGVYFYPKFINRLSFHKKTRRHKKHKFQNKKAKSFSASSQSEEYSYLLDAEKKILEELKSADRNELWQKQLQLKTQFSKAKLSRMIRNLESRNLITKIPFGNTNKIRLK